MSQLSDAWNGVAPQTQLSGWSPWIKAPSYDFSSQLYSYLSTMLGKPAPRWQGFGGMKDLAAQKNPLGGEMSKMANAYYGLGMPTVFGQATGSIGRYMNPSFQSPVARAQLGAPNYFGPQAIPSAYAPPQLPSSINIGAG